MNSPDPRARGVRQAALMAVAFLLAFGCLGLLILQSDAQPREPLIPRNLQNAVFEPAPQTDAARTLTAIWADLTGPAGRAFLQRLAPTQSGVLWIALLVSLVVAFDFGRPRSPRNTELVALLVIGFLLFDVMRFFDYLTDPVYFQVMDWMFGAIMAASLFLLARALWRLRYPHLTRWQPNLPLPALKTLALLLLSLNVFIGLVSPPDDAGYYTNLGAQRLRERGRFPYGDPLLSGSAGAGYGPVLFLAHLPFQMVLDPEPVNPQAPDKPDLVGGPPYYAPPPLATQLTAVMFHLIGVAALVAIGRRLAGPEVAWGLAALYCGSAYVMGVGGPREMIGGMTFISHIAPPSLALLAFALLSRPMAAGACLALSVATVFYPLFFIPAWLGHYWQRRQAALRFLAGMALAAILVGGPVLALSQPAGGRGLLGTVITDTVGHHQGDDTYGLSPFGFWGLRDGVRAWLRDGLLPGQVTTSPMFLVAAAFSLASFFLARGSTPQQLALLSGALGIAAQLWKIHGTGVYVTWYFPFLLIGFFAHGRPAAPHPPPSDPVA